MSDELRQAILTHYSSLITQHSLLFLEIESAAQALLSSRVIDVREIIDLDLPVKIAAREQPDDLCQLVAVDIAVRERDVRKPHVRRVVMRGAAFGRASEPVPNFRVQMIERRRTNNRHVEHGLGCGKDSKSSCADDKRLAFNGDFLQRLLDRFRVVSFRHLICEMRKGRGVDAAHAERLREFVPHLFDQFVMLVVEQ